MLRKYTEFLQKKPLMKACLLKEVSKLFLVMIYLKHNYIIGHNISFDNNIVGCEFLRSQFMANLLVDKISIDTKK